MPEFILTVVASRDGFIARNADEPPQAWASPEEQALFFADVRAADWSIMGRRTHEATPKSDRRRIVFSTGEPGWRTPTQLWLDPSGLTPRDLARCVEAVHPLDRGLILGGTRVHDWFLAARAIDVVHLTVEPVTFGEGLPIFSGAAPAAPLRVFKDRGFAVVEDRSLNAAGTRWYRLTPA